MASDLLPYVEIVDRGDPLLLPWLDLYETAFPPNERFLVSYFLRLLRDREAGTATDMQLLALPDDAGDLDAMACASIPAGQVACLWFIAVGAARRGQGLGSALYREIARRAQAAGCPAMLFEVDIPELEPDEPRRQIARRRIGFYRRLGARLLGGIHYVQYVGSHQPPTPMHLMVHALVPADGAGALAWAQALFGGSVRQVGTPTLD
jgi:ribosomal protein S18 acetylase RimI-like enzyme